MKAVVVNGYGPPEEFEVADVPVPRPGPGQLQVRISAAAINPTDVALPSGVFHEQAPLTFPHVPGNDFAGTVTEVGPGVTAYRAGDEIFGSAVPRALRLMASPTRPSLGTGALAEYAVVEADTPLIAHRPPAVPPEEAAALATAGFTALALMGMARLKADETVLVVGASGGVGTAVIPLIAAAGARVIATGTEADSDILRGLGAHEIIGYDEAGYPGGVDVAFNLVLPGDRLIGLAKALRSGGRLFTIMYPPPSQEQVGRDDVDVRFVLDVEGTYGGMREVGEYAADGRLRPTISRRYTLDQGVQACVDFVREHTTGKLVVSV